MGKRIIQQARGHGSFTYRVRRKAYIYRIGYPMTSGQGKVLTLVNSPAHSAPLAKISINEKIFYNPACEGLQEGQHIEIGGKAESGSILELKNIPAGTRIYNIEANPGDGGRFIRSGGSSAMIIKKMPGKVSIIMPSKKEIILDERCRASMGVIAGQGRLEKPIVKAGKMWFIKKSRNKLWPRTSAVKMNAVDHPFGSGRGKRIKSKIAKRNAPPGAKVGHLRPRRTGKKR
jgi:large subunit ribosomal protein L2